MRERDGADCLGALFTPCAKQQLRVVHMYKGFAQCTRRLGQDHGAGNQGTRPRAAPDLVQTRNQRQSFCMKSALGGKTWHDL
jgi:hypothetical protein